MNLLRSKLIAPITALAITLVGCAPTVQQRVENARKEPWDKSWFSPALKATQSAIIRFRTREGHWPRDERELLGHGVLEVNYMNAHGFVSEPFSPPDLTVKLEDREDEAMIYAIKIRSEKVRLKVTSENWWWGDAANKD